MIKSNTLEVPSIVRLLARVFVIAGILLAAQEGPAWGEPALLDVDGRGSGGIFGGGGGGGGGSGGGNGVVFLVGGSWRCGGGAGVGLGEAEEVADGAPGGGLDFLWGLVSFWVEIMGLERGGRGETALLGKKMKRHI